MKILQFSCRGEFYMFSLEPEALGWFILPNGNNNFECIRDWQFLGVSKHRWSNHVTVPLTADINPEELVGGIVWDCEYGTIRSWCELYLGRTPRIECAYFGYISYKFFRNIPDELTPVFVAEKLSE